MDILKKILPVFAAIFFAGCTETFDPKIEQKPVLCINSHITAGRPIEVKVTHSWKYNDADAEKEHSVTDAQVTVYANGQAVDADYTAAEGDDIVIEARSPQYGYAEAEVTVPHAVPVKAINFTPQLINRIANTDSEKRFFASLIFDLNVDLTFDDLAGSYEYYHCIYSGFNNSDTDGTNIGIFPGWSGQEGEDRCFFFPGTLNYDAEPLFSEHIDEFESVMGSDSFGFSFFSDRQINGAEYTLKLAYTNLHYSLSAAELEEQWTDCGLKISLCCISPSYYNWLRCRWESDNGIAGNLSDLGLADPIWGYSNVSTGAGVVVAEARSECIISLKDFINESISASSSPAHSE